MAERVTEQLRQSIGEVALKVGGRNENALRDELRLALDLGQFQVHYQPRAALSNGAIVGVEALLRWNHPLQGLLLPDRFLPIAEEIGFIEALDEWVLREAVAAAKVWRIARPALRVTVNVSPVSIRRDALLALSRLSHSEREIETIDLSELAGSVLRNLRAQYPLMQIEADIQPGLQVQGDPGMIRSAIENLLGNALKFSSAQPVARIRLFQVQTPDGEAFCVADEGAGFDMKHADRLFRVFQRMHSEHEFPGTGIGLASVKRIIMRHGGKVWAESEPGKGAKFYFTIPSSSSVQG